MREVPLPPLNVPPLQRPVAAVLAAILELDLGDVLTVSPDGRRLYVSNGVSLAGAD